MINYFLVFMLCASPCLAGMGTGGFPYPGPGVMASGGSACQTQSLLIDQSGTLAYNIATIEDGNNTRGLKVTGNGKKLHSIVLKTGGEQGASTTYTMYVNTTTSFSGTNTDSFSVVTPSTTDTEFTGSSTNRPVLTNGTDYYIAIGKSDASWGYRLGLTAVADVSDGNYWYSQSGLGSFTQCAGCSRKTWAKVYVCD